MATKKTASKKAPAKPAAAQVEKKEAKKLELQGSAAARAWNATKADGDPEWDNMPNTEFKGKLEHAAERVKATGIAQTNFEVEVKKQLEVDAKVNKAEGAMAVVNPNPATDTAAPMGIAPEQNEQLTTKEKAEVKKAADAKAKEQEGAKKLDQSGHVPDKKELEARVEAEKTAPLRP